MHKAILFLAMPVVAERILQMAVGVADIAMVGRLGPLPVAAVGISNQIAMITMNVGNALHVGSTAVVARSVGAGDIQTARHAGRQALILGVTLSLAMLALTLMLATPGLSLLGAQQDVVDAGLPYLRLKAISMVFGVITMTCAAVLRGAGDTRTPMWVGGSVNVLNVFLNYVLIFGHLGFPALGVTGAGAATAIARGLGMLAMLALFLSSRSVLPLDIRSGLTVHLPTISRIVNIGLPAAGERLLMKSGQLIFTAIVVSLGTTAYAAHQVALRIESLTFMPGFALGVAATTMVGQNLGAGQPARARQGGYTATHIGLGLGLVVGTLFFFWAPAIVALFIPGHPEVVRQGAEVLRVIALVQPALALNLIISGALRGAGDTRLVMLINGSSIWSRVALAYLLVNVAGLGLLGAWLGMAADLLLRSLFLLLRYRSGRWLYLRV